MPLYLYFKAPFGTFRPFQSVEMLATTAFLTHSAAYGLLLGLAGINREKKRNYLDAQIAIGIKRRTQGGKYIGDDNYRRDEMKPQLPRRGRVFQQLHRIPQGSGKKEKEEKERAKGSKSERIGVYWREVLIGLEGYIGLRDERLEPLVRRGVNEPHTLDYWGLPFMGDNNFFLESLKEEEHEPTDCFWFRCLDPANIKPNDRYFFLSVWTDYIANARSNNLLFALTEDLNVAWQVIEEKKVD